MAMAQHMLIPFMCFWILCLSVLSESPSCHKDGYAIHQNKTHIFPCCKILTCGKGTEPVMQHSSQEDSNCADSSMRVSCKKCPEGTFQPYVMESFKLFPCRQWQRCDDEGEMIDPKKPSGTRKSDRECACVTSEDYHRVTYRGEKLCQRRWCDAGTHTADDLDRANCEPCPSGYMKLEPGFHRCYPEGSTPISTASPVTAADKKHGKTPKKGTLKKKHGN